MKKRFPKLLFCLLSLLAIFWFLLIPKKVNVSNVNLTYGNKTETVKLPIQKIIPQNTDFIVSLDLFVADNEKQEYNVVPDDCIKKIVINNKEIPLNGVEGLCSYPKGAIIDFTRYLNIGNNKIEFLLHNNGGQGGLRLNKNENKSCLIYIVFIALLFICLFLSLRKLKFGFRACFVIFLGIAIRIIYYGNDAILYEFDYDFNQHLTYINIIEQEKRLLAANECFVCYHSPLNYIILAPFSYDFNLLKQVPMLFSFLTIIFGVALIHRALGKNMLAFLASLICVLWPGFVLTSTRIGNDVPFYFASVFCMYFTYSWMHSKKNSHLILATFGAALSLAFKSTGFIILGVWVITYICGVFKNFKIGSLKAIIISVILIILSLIASNYRAIENFIENGRISIVGNAGGLPDGLKVKNEFGNYIYFDLKDYIMEPYASPWTDKGGRQYFWNYALKTSLFGEFKLWNSPFGRTIASILSILALFIFILALWGIIHVRFNEIPLLLFAVFLFAGLIYLRANYPYSCSNDFRYIFPVIFPIAYFSVRGVQIMQNKRLRVLSYAAMLTFSVLSFIVIAGLFVFK